MKAGSKFVGKLFLMIVFAASFPQWPLYSSNQNTYFLRGLANAAVGYLNLDWLSQTVDLFPVFSALISVTLRVFNENTFYFLYVAILATYAYSILGIASFVSDIGNSSAKYLSYFVLLTIWYSGLLVRLLLNLPGSWRIASLLDRIGVLTEGVAGQYLLRTFQPSTFGVFLVLSIYAFLRNKPFVAVACLAIASAFHPVYLLSAAVLTCTYMSVIVVRGKDYRKALWLGAFAFVLVIPILVFIYLNFGPTTADIYAQAQRILVDYRIPHHAQVARWFGTSTLFQLTLVAFSIYLVRRTRLFPLLLAPLLAAMVLTVVQVITGNKSLALLFPWRISVFLVPIASAVVLATIVSVAFRIFSKPISRFTKPLLAGILAAVLILGYLAVDRTITLLNTPRRGVSASTRFVASTFQLGNLYLIPPDMASFRLAASVPIFIDYKSHPYKDTEIVEWFDRVEIARDFYASSGDSACSILRNTTDKYNITHVVLGSDSSNGDCGTLHKVYGDSDFAIYEVRGH